MTDTTTTPAGAVGRPCGFPDATLPDLVVAQARRTPDAVAVRQWGREVRYHELVGAAAALAARLRQHGAGPGQLVGVCHGRRPELVVAVLGVLLSGAGYVPLDQGHPRRRLADMAADAGLRVTVVDRKGAELIGGLGPDLVHVPAPARAAGTGGTGGPDPGPMPAGVPRAAAEPAGMSDIDAVPRCPAVPAGVAHVLYTSGSTGRPKGVLTTHRNIVAFATVWAAETGVTTDTRALGLSSPAFDAFTFDVFVPLLAGASVQLATESDRADPVRLARFAAEHRVSWGFITPAVLDVLDPSQLPDWLLLMVGGEVVEPALVHAWTGQGQPPGRRFLHVYGTTETTVIVTAAQLSGRWTQALPIGRPLPNHRAHVVDGELRPVAVGQPGELLIGGPGVAHGYLGVPALTAERFVPDPYSGEPGAVLYRTGDIVRWLPDGRLGYVGRRDGQVQVRGQRVELGEIEAVIRSHPAVEQVAVEAVPAGSGIDLVAFVGATATLTTDDVREHCAKRLTSAMVPRRVVRLDALPVNPTTGKLDRGRLRARLAGAAPAAAGPAGAVSTPTGSPRTGSRTGLSTGLSTGPRTGPGTGTAALEPLQLAVANVWSRVLGGRTPGAEQDFFAAGGHSIAVMRLVAGVRAELGVDVSAEDVFAGRTLAGIAEQVANAGQLPGGQGSGVRAGNPPTLSPSQRRLWFIDKLAPDSAAYNVAFAERLRGALDAGALHAALSALAERHDVLRWRIVGSGGVPFAVCDPPGEAALEQVDLRGDPPQRLPELLAELLARAAATPFDLAAGPVWRSTLYRTADDEHVLCLVLHHAVVDGWSQAVLYRDLATFYASRSAGSERGYGDPPTLPPLPVRYADYAVWRAERDRRLGDQDLRWWADHLAGAPVVLDLPRDRPRPAVQTYNGAAATAQFPVELDAGVRQLAAGLGATPSLVLLTGFGQLLRRLTDRPDNLVGMVFADRREAVFEDLVGFFVDIVPVLLRADDRASFAHMVRRCLDEFLHVTSHPAAPLERIVDAIGVPRDLSRAPLVQVLFNVFNFAEPRLELPGLDGEPVPVAMPGSPFDMTVYVVERGGRLALDVVYNPDLYDRARVYALLDDYVALVGALVAEPDRPVRAVAPDRPDPARHRPAAPPSEPARRPAQAPPPGTGGELRTQTEVAVAGVWRDVLGGTLVGPTDNFFDIGGHSMAILTVQARLTELFGVDLSVVDLFRHPNVRGLATHLDRRLAGGDRPAMTPELVRAMQRGAARRNRGPRRPMHRGGVAAAETEGERP